MVSASPTAHSRCMDVDGLVGRGDALADRFAGEDEGMGGFGDVFPVAGDPGRPVCAAAAGIAASAPPLIRTVRPAGSAACGIAIAGLGKHLGYG